jgi:diacylglycerol kinase family enzyme
MLPVLINRIGGTAARMGERLEAEVREAFHKARVAIDLQLIRGDEMTEAVSAVAAAPMVAVGGGDGTLGCAAGVLAGSGTALAILPLGTRNHLAHELGIPDDLGEVARLIAQGPRRTIDLGRVGDRVFVNNASIGLYPALVRRRDEHPAPKWLAALPAAVGALGRLRHHRLRLILDGEPQPVVTPLLFVGNNRYTLHRPAIGTREALDDGKLSVYAVASRRRLALIGFALRTLAGRADPGRDFAAIGDVARLKVEGHGRHIDVALDGEVVRLPLPLAFASDAGALTVIAPDAARLSGDGASPRPAA